MTIAILFFLKDIFVAYNMLRTFQRHLIQKVQIALGVLRQPSRSLGLYWLLGYILVGAPQIYIVIEGPRWLRK